MLFGNKIYSTENSNPDIGLSRKQLNVTIDVTILNAKGPNAKKTPSQLVFLCSPNWLRIVSKSIVNL